MPSQERMSLSYCALIIEISLCCAHLIPRLRSTALLQINPTLPNYAKQVHAQFIINGLLSPFFKTKLIEQYCFIPSAVNSHHARLLIEQSQESKVLLFNTSIRCSLPRDALLAFTDSVSKGNIVFDDLTYNFLIGACARSSSSVALGFARQVHALITSHGFIPSMFVQTTLIHCYASKMDMSSARKVFDEMVDKSHVTWNALLAGYCSQREKVSLCPCNALMLFKQMLVDVSGVKPTNTTMVCVLSATSRLGLLETGYCVHAYIEKTIYFPESDVFIGTGLIDMYSKCGCLNGAFSVFDRMKDRNVLTWTAMATGLANHGRGNEAVELLEAMIYYGVNPNPVTFSSLLSACCHNGLVEEGLHLFCNMKSKFGVIPLIQHYGCVVDPLGRAGYLEAAYDFLKSMPAEPDAILWRSLLSACNLHGNLKMAEKVGKLLVQLDPEPNSAIRDMTQDYISISNVYAAAGRWSNVEDLRKEMKREEVFAKHRGSSELSTIRLY